ncbi:MAG: phosphoenolpyruvate--protein phosphotransferase [Nostocaceae cyanobacterium]|nr:phosphoenolpyruvate--protein phosphotransferase [Nostocaceae cyanobacterium]
MVGIVIVSHSKKLAIAVRELALQMVQGTVSVAIAAGIDDLENSLGTDAMQVYQAIESIYSDDGVLVLMDLGSALMSAEMALEFLPEEHRQKVHLCAAPLVEGAVAAAVAAAMGNNIQQVMAEARGALAAKTMHLGVDSITQFYHHSYRADGISNHQEHFLTQPPQEISLTVSNRLGLHARPAAQFVATAALFQSHIEVRNMTRNTQFVRADSINQVATLGARQGHELKIIASGVDAPEALAALQALLAANFGEDDTSSSSPIREERLAFDLVGKGGLGEHSHQGEMGGIAASGGVAIAPVVIYRPTPLQLLRNHVMDADCEWEGLIAAMQTARGEIETLLSQTSTKIGDAEAAIFDAHLLCLDDPVLMETLHQRIFEEYQNAEVAWQGAIDELVTQYSHLDDSYLQERVADVVDVGQRVLRLLVGTTAEALNFSQPTILVTHDLSPSQTAQLDPSKVLGICTTVGSATSHTAILARTLGIPAVVGVSEEILLLSDGTLLGLDGETGTVWIEPTADTIALLQAKQQTWQAAVQQARSQAPQLPMTCDGQRVTVMANIASINDALAAVELGAEGVGLLRTEFLYLERKNPPTEEEQLAVYREILQVMGNLPVVIRTLDVGGDKPLPYLNLPPENNPFLGWRGIRFCLDRPDLFKTQLRAILRASVGDEIRLMFPMISTLGEVRKAKDMLAEVKEELRQGGIAFAENMAVGIMIEVPSAVAIADQLAAEVDFFSIGTNDLSQYIMAGDRTNPRVASLADAFHPAVLRMVQQTVAAAHKAGICVGICGEVASDPLAAPILLGLGLNGVSLNPLAIPIFKQRISQLTIPQAQAIASLALEQEDAVQVRQIISTSLGGNG